MPKQKTKKKPLKHSRRHHIVPQFYLAGFTDSGKKDGLLWVLDMNELRQWRGKPKNVAFQTNFYLLKLPGIKTDIVERVFQKLESKVAPIIRKIINTKTLPIDEDYSILITWVALMALKTPRFRSIYEEPMVEIGKFVLQSMLANSEHWETTKKRMKRDGYKVDNETNYEDMKRFVESDDYTIRLSQECHVELLFDAVNEIIPSLMTRRWSLLFVKDKSDEFICSDSPVALKWTKPMPQFDSPGFERENTVVTMPLNKYVALHGRFEGASSNILVSSEVVALINTFTCIYGQRFIYSPKEEFIWLKKDNNIGKLDDFLKELKRDKRDSKGKSNTLSEKRKIRRVESD